MTRHVGVEEELLLVHPETGQALAVASAALDKVPDGAGGPEEGGLTSELTREQIETATRPCTSLETLGAELRRWRLAAATAAEASGAQVAALATPPLPVRPSITSSPRYRHMVDEFGLTAQQQLTCGCHVHVQIESEEEGVGILDRIRGWLAPLLALSANSPFWQGEDSRYASFRAQVWKRWPSAGPTELFGSAETYRATVQAMINSGALLDEGMIYFDARLSATHPTVEIRVADVCLLPDDAVLLAALARALVDTAATAWRAGEPPVPLRVELLRLAAWRASRSGIDGDLLGLTGRPVPTKQVLRTLIQHVGPALRAAGECDLVEDLLTAVLRRGNGANAQRRTYRRTAHLPDVVRDAVRCTTGR